MDNSQIQYLFRTDKYLKKISCKCVLESELPDEIVPESIYFILTNSKKMDVKFSHGPKHYLKGHWTLLESLQKSKKKSQISYFDATGGQPTLSVAKKMRNFRLKYNADLFINTDCFQMKFSSICGPIACYVALLRARAFNYDDITTHKLSQDLMFIVKWLPDLIASLLNSSNKTLSRFSFDLLL